jgi:hypothetical protein
MNPVTSRPVPARLQACIWLLVCTFTSFASFAQSPPDYDFRNASLISGTDLQVNAVYLFQNVKAGVDATITITDITGGIVLSDIDSPWSGYVEALQPVLMVPPLSSGYIEFEINFFIAGTSTPMVQAEIPATPIDIDGQTYPDGAVNEFDVLQLTNGYIDYDMLGGELNMNLNSPWVTGVNVLTVDYPAVDTTPRQVMFTTVNAALSTFTFRTGATSLATEWHQRLRSIYFKKFQYPNSFLPVAALSSFNGHLFNNKISINWGLAGGSNIKTVYVEKAGSEGVYTTILKMPLNSSEKNTAYSFVDNVFLPGKYYYRLRLINAEGLVQYSNTLLFQKNDAPVGKLTIVTGAGNQFTAQIMADKNEAGTIRVFDFNGRMVYQKKLLLQQGFNSIALEGLNGLKKTGYVLSLETGRSVSTRKLIIQ